MTTGVLERGTPTPHGRLVFVPVDGRRLITPTRDLLDDLPSQAAIEQVLEDLQVARHYGHIPRAADWVLVACLASLRTEFNTLAPGRNKASDGSIGDTAHAASSSDHNPDETGATPYEDSDNINEVHAIDVTAAGPWPLGLTMQDIIDVIVAEHRAGRDDRLQNIIYNRRIISRSWGWDSWHTYTGSNAHTQHAHFSARYTTAQESDTSPWGVAALREPAPQEDDVSVQDVLDAFDKPEMGDKLANLINTRPGLKRAVAQAVLGFDPGKNADGTIPIGAVQNPADADGTNPTVGPNWGLNRAIVAATVGYQVRDRVDAVAAAVTPIGQAVAKILTNVQADDEESAQILAAIEATRLGNPDQSAEDIADALRTVLGERAAEVGALLAGPGA